MDYPEFKKMKLEMNARAYKPKTKDSIWEIFEIQRRVLESLGRDAARLV